MYTFFLNLINTKSIVIFTDKKKRTITDSLSLVAGTRLERATSGL